MDLPARFESGSEEVLDFLSRGGIERDMGSASRHTGDFLGDPEVRTATFGTKADGVARSADEAIVKRLKGR